MDNYSSSHSPRPIVWIILVFVVLIAGGLLVASVNKNIRNTLNPLQQANNLLNTQVAGFLHPTPTIIPDPVTIIHEVRSLAKLETIQYSVEKVITAEMGQGAFAFLFQDRLLLVAHGTVIAGIDMEKLTPEDMWLQNGVLNVHLPPAEIFIATLDNQQTYVYERDTGLLRRPDKNLETLARQAAEDEIRKAAMQDGILTIAQQNAEAYLTRLFLALGYHEVIFVATTPTPTP